MTTDIFPAWLDIEGLFLEGVPLAELANLTASDFPIPPADPRTSEDCLFLDVILSIYLVLEDDN